MMTYKIFDALHYLPSFKSKSTASRPLVCKNSDSGVVSFDLLDCAKGKAQN